MSDYMKRGGANLHGVFPTSTETEEILARTRQAAGDFYASTLAEKLGIRDSGGFVRASLAPYNTAEEVGGSSRPCSGSRWGIIPGVRPG